MLEKGGGGNHHFSSGPFLDPSLRDFRVFRPKKRHTIIFTNWGPKGGQKHPPGGTPPTPLKRGSKKAPPQKGVPPKYGYLATIPPYFRGVKMGGFGGQKGGYFGGYKRG